MTTIDQALLLAVDLRPYYARAISALRPTPMPEAMIQALGSNRATLAVDKHWRLYFNPRFLEAHTTQEIASIIAAHEVEHLLRNHSERRDIRDPMAWNAAGDLEINDDATDVTLPEPHLHPKNMNLPVDQMAEWYYDNLPKSPDCQCGSGAGQPIAGEFEPDDLSVNPILAESIREAVAEDVRQHETSNPGSVPAGVVVWANTRAEKPHVPWTRILAKRLGNLRRAVRGRSDYSWAKPGRRHKAVLRPGSVSYPPKVSVLVDTSGSMGEEGAIVLGAVKEIARRAGAQFFECDVAANKTKGKEFRGGGGTDLRNGFDLVSKDHPNLVIVISDGETPWPDSKPDFDTVLLLTNDRTPNVPPWLETIRMRAAKR